MNKSLLLFATAIFAGSSLASTYNVVPAGKCYPKNPRLATKFVVGDEMSKVREKADEEVSQMSFGFADANEANWVAYKMNSIPSGTCVYQAVKLGKNVQGPLVGSKIVGLRVITGSSSSGTNLVTKVSGFVSPSLYQVPEFRKGFTLTSQPYTEQDLMFNEGYEITGEEDLYFGYNFAYNYSVAPNFIVADGNVRSSTVNALGFTESLKAVPTEDDWMIVTNQTGNLCIWLLLEGDNLPKNLATAKEILVDPYYGDDKLSYFLQVANDASNDIKSIDVTTKVSDGTVYSRTINLESPLKPGQRAEVEVTNVPNRGNGIIEISSTIVKVNGVSVPEGNQSTITAYSTAYQNGYPRNLVVEEATATGCQYCPAGIVFMEYLKKTYPDRWCRIAVHANAYNDPIPCATYSNWINTYIAGFPSAIINRVVSISFYSDADYNNETADKYYKMFTAYPAYGNIALNAECDESNKTVKITSTSEFSFDIPSDYPHLLSYVVIEDGVGPYNQTNAYSGTQYQMDGWQNKDKFVPTIYEDVARTLHSFPGIPNSLPTTIEQHTPYTNTATLSIENVKNDQFRIVGMITNSVTGEIINASEIDVFKTGINNIFDCENNVTVIGGNGVINVTGADEVAVYTLDGKKVGTQNLSRGLYIVIANGKTSKVFVK